MGRKLTNFTSEIKELIAPVKENKNSNWAKYVAKISYNDKPANIDIRNIKFEDNGEHLLGKGISLTDEECDTLVDILVDRGYGNNNTLEKSLSKRKSIFKGSNIFDDDEEDDDIDAYVVYREEE